jgi:hypothetical protein
MLSAAVSCVFPPNVTNASASGGANFTHVLHIPAGYFYYKRIEVALETYVIPVICLCGLLGNLLNILVLSRRRLYLSLEQLERSVHTGLLALAVSDMLFCLTLLPHAFRDRRQFSASRPTDFWLVYNTYSGALINTWLLCSAWITVALAVCRYLAVCRPLSTQWSSRTIRNILVLVVLSSILLNLPRFWTESITSVPCIEGGRSYYAVPGPVKETALLGYECVYFVLAIVVPVIILIYCTVHLILVLQKSQQLRRHGFSSRMHSAAQNENSSSSRNVVTVTLCVIVIFYVLLVIPAEVSTFVRHFMKKSSSLSMSMHYSLAVKLCNILQAINFSFNFLLYCIINVHFRKVTRDIMAQLMARRTCSKAASSATEETLPMRRDADNV